MYIYLIFPWILLYIVVIFRNFYGGSANKSWTKPPIHITPLPEAFETDGDEYVSDSDNVGSNNTTVVENEWEEEVVISEDPSSTTNEEVDVNRQQPKKRQKQNVRAF